MLAKSHKILALIAPAAVCAILLVACRAEPRSSAELSNIRGGESGEVREPYGDAYEGLDLGDGWIDELAASGSVGAEPGRIREGGAIGGSGGTTPGSTGAKTRSSYWGIVLGTFSHEAHREAAMNMIRSAATIDPRLGKAHVHSKSSGSMVVHGIYNGPDDPAAKRDLEWIKAIEINDRPVFPSVVLTRVHADRARGDFREIELLSVRRRLPNLHPLYTLQVAAWGDFESGKLSLDQIRGSAEAYARELRGQRYEAYVHHDDELRISAVTIGLFDHTAVDAQSGIYSAEVEHLMRKFPSHLVNGEPLYELIDKKRPKLGRRVQSPRLMLVPKL